MNRRFLLCLFVSLCCLQTSNAQEKAKDIFLQSWQKVDSLLEKGLPKSAVETAKDILGKARQNDNNANSIKAQLFIMVTQRQFLENPDSAAIREAEAEISKAQGVEKALWQSITAEMYWNYYQQYRYRLLQRTTLAETVSPDIATWDAPTFFRKIAQLYQASLSNGELIKSVATTKYAPIIVAGKNTQHLRPTLFDLLSFRALEFFKNDEKDLYSPAYQFEMDGSMWFAEADRFALRQVKVKDASSLHFQALLLYQQIIAFHLNDKKPDALIDADLYRLQFVHQNSSHPEKDSLYLDALRNLASNYPNNPATAEVSFRIAHQQLGNEPGYIPYYRKQYRNSFPEESRDIPAIVKDLERIVANYPESEGGIHAFNLLQKLKQPFLEIRAGKAYIPNANIKVLISYKNTDHAYLSLFKIPNKPDMGWSDFRDSEKLLKKIRHWHPLRTWQQELPGSGDMETHSTEIKVDALPKGAYLLVVSSLKNLKEGNAIIGSTKMQVSDLSLIEMKRLGEADDLYVLNRKSGKPIADVQLTFWERKWNKAEKDYYPKIIGRSRSDDNGKAIWTEVRDEINSNAITAISGVDTLQISQYFDYKIYDEHNRVRTFTFLFTDRSIYRPGQTLYFKGILVKATENGSENDIVPNANALVVLKDANRQEIDSIKVKTNGFGSFSGKFTVPANGLTGKMSLSSGNERIYFSVEEYKRPKFYVDFDTLKGEFALNQQISLKGFAKAYAGNTIDGATVKYRVVRSARFPYSWRYNRWGMPHTSQTEIANGTTTTHTDGTFDISFQTLPDKSVNPETLPLFSYTVYADVTDINGETRSSEQRVHAGYRSLQIVAQIAEQGRPEDLDSLLISTLNLNNVFVPTQLKITVSPLKFPGKIYRQRLWDKPDQFAMTESEFRAAFPDDEYKDEGDYRTWGKAGTTFQQSFTATQNDKIPIPKKAWQNEGWYIIEISGEDAQGNAVLEKKYTYLVTPTKNDEIQKPFVVQSSQKSYQPGEKAGIWLSTGFEDVYVLGKNSLGTPSEILKTGKFTHIVGESDRGGIGFSWLYVHNNRGYTASKILTIPWSNKDLHLSWATHRNKLLPGAAEEWILTISGDKKEKVAAELLVGMYDASLDAFEPHSWSWGKLLPDFGFSTYWGSYGFGLGESSSLQTQKMKDMRHYPKIYDRLTSWAGYGYGYSKMDLKLRGKVAGLSAAASQEIMASGFADGTPEALNETVVVGYAPPIKEELSLTGDIEQAPPSIRKNFNETAFFLPQLHTDERGNIKFKFTVPEALTQWKFMAFAHTKDWKTGYLQGKIKTQKELMVMPNLPRFLRQGDDIVISTKISNLSDKDLAGTAALEILNALTFQPVDLSFRLTEKNRSFTVKQNQSTEISWSLHVPESMHTPVVLRISAKSGNFTDGEENTLPLITNRVLVTETLPLPIRGNETKNFSFDKLKNQGSNSLSNHALTVEFTGNPAWYAVQALPYLMEYPYECAEQTFNRFYANALATHIVSLSPKMKEIFNRWETVDSAALLSNLEKNQELKSALLAETPWVMEAKNETEQKHRIALLFESHKLSQNLESNLLKLQQMQMPEGAFPWFKGMHPNRYITQYIISGMAKLQHLDTNNTGNKRAKEIITKALIYLDGQLQKDYDQLIKMDADMEKQQIGYLQIQYLYMRSFFAEKAIPAESKKAFSYYKKQAASYWNPFNPYMKGMIALALNRLGENEVPQQILASLKENAINNTEMGMYWKNMPHGYWWYQAPIEAQALLIEAFAEVAHDDESVDAMKAWLLKQKQTQNWGTTKATADACYALLANGSDWLINQPEVTIHLGDKLIRSSEIKTEAGTGYFKQRIEGADVKPEMGNINVKVERIKNEGLAWGAVYWQYFEDLDKITSAETPLSLKKQLFIVRNSDTGPVLTEIQKGNELKVGDKVKVRIVLRVDRDMEYVHLKDMRAACFEPLNVLSGYRYQGGLGYYESTKDVSTNFFFDYLRKGIYVFEYPVFVGQKGDFSDGISTIQCMYAPEFSSHSKGIRVQVK